MGYEQLSTVIVLIIVLIGVVVWLPIRTSNSMRHVEEHRDDRYSTSLHLVDENSGTRFSDDTAFAKGVQMQPSERRANTLTPERISEVRRLRHAAVRRRQMIVAALLVITVVVLVLSLTLHFSTLFALIPAALTAIVLALGAHAASQARAWERKVAEAKARERRSRAARLKARKARAEQEAASTRPSAGDNAPTNEMTSVEIRRALRQAQLEQRKALAERARREAEAQARAAAQAQAQIQAQAQAAAAEAARLAQEEAQAKQDQGVAGPEQTARPAQPQAQTTQPQTSGQTRPQAGAPVMVAPQQAVSGATGAPVVDAKSAAARQQADATSDHTTELAEVHPARALDAYDMATSQDLISFSLGEARNVEDDEPKAPESREIKSMRQVAKAEPVDAERERELAKEARIETEPAGSAAPAMDAEGTPQTDDAPDAADESVVEAVDEAGEPQESAEPVQKAGMNDVEAFHEAEEQAKVAVPAATSDSLGHNLAEILARRGA